MGSELVEVPNSAGTTRPRIAAPEGACDSHIHIYDPRFSAARSDVAVVAGATAADYRLLQGRIGTTRTVVVQPAAYGTDNRVTLDAIEQLGPGSARGRPQPQTARTRKNSMIVVISIVSVTAMPYAAARRLDDWK